MAQSEMIERPRVRHRRLIRLGRAIHRRPRHDRARAGGQGRSPQFVEQPIDTSSAAGRAFLRMLGVFAGFETAIRKEHQMEGIAAAKGAGVYKGRPPSIKPAAVAALKAKGLGATEIAKQLKIGRASVYRVIADAQSSGALSS